MTCWPAALNTTVANVTVGYGWSRIINGSANGRAIDQHAVRAAVGILLVAELKLKRTRMLGVMKLTVWPSAVALRFICSRPCTGVHDDADRRARARGHHVLAFAGQRGFRQEGDRGRRHGVGQ